MADVKINIPGFGEIDGHSPIVILGPNGSGKTQLAQKIASDNQVSAISAQRRTWVDEGLPVQEEHQLRSNMQSQQNRWREHSWQPTEEINFLLSTLIQDHTNILTRRNEEAIEAETSLDPVRDTKLIRLQDLWTRLFPKRKLEISGFFPKVRRLDADDEMPLYQLRQMSDGERTVLYMAARVLAAQEQLILVDEPELHMHSRLSVRFWDEAEKLRPDCRFLYITHDLNFTMSRRDATVLITRPGDVAEAVFAQNIPSSIAMEILGAATLPFYAKRIFFFEGEPGRGFASEFFAAWFDGVETFTIPSGNRASVFAAVSGLATVGLAAADVIGLVDRDYYSDSALRVSVSGVTVLDLHEIESVLCDQQVVAALAEHLGKDTGSVWRSFLDCVRKEYNGQNLSAVVAQRVRSRVRELLDGAFNGGQIATSLEQTCSNHCKSLEALDVPAKTSAMFTEESQRVQSAVITGGVEMLQILPGKHLLGLLSRILGMANASQLQSLVIRSLDMRHLGTNDPLFALPGRRSKRHSWPICRHAEYSSYHSRPISGSFRE
ncbi:MAG: AAA family ATPase [Ardenticatenales bacterium]|nr:AAA family ATPase [Ardenticatenales bacterium]